MALTSIKRPTIQNQQSSILSNNKVLDLIRQIVANEIKNYFSRKRNETIDPGFWRSSDSKESMQKLSSPLGQEYVINNSRTGITLDRQIKIGDGVNFIINTGTGSKIGTASTQKLGFYGVTPVDKPDTITDADGSLASVTTVANTLIDRLQELGLIQ